MPEYLHFSDRATWRSWLEANHHQAKDVWLVFFKKHTGKANIAYDHAVEEALCFGWIDSLIKRLDDDRYARKFTPRVNTRKWSKSNLERLDKVMATGAMTPAGLATIPSDPKEIEAAPEISDDPPDFLAAKLERHPRAKAFFEQLAPSYRRAYIGWLSAAKREETRTRRLAEAIELLSAGRKLGMK